MRFSWESDRAGPPRRLGKCRAPDVVFLSEEDDKTTITTIPIFLVVRESDEADLHIYVVWGADDLCESNFVMQNPTNFQRAIRISRE